MVCRSARGRVLKEPSVGCSGHLERRGSRWAQTWVGITLCLQMFAAHKGQEHLARRD